MTVDTRARNSNYNDHKVQISLLASRFLASFFFNHSRSFSFAIHAAADVWEDEDDAVQILFWFLAKKKSRFRPTQLDAAHQLNSMSDCSVQFECNWGPFERTQFPFTFVATRASHVQWSSTAASLPFSCLALIAF